MSISEYVDAVINENDWEITNLSNVSACINEKLSDVSWVGFYLTRDLENSEKELVLGPFQGKVACTHIAYGRGVCGDSAKMDKTIIVADVSGYKGYIACDSEARSEIVIPLHDHEGNVIGVLDIDSNTEGRFTQPDDESSDLEECARIIERILSGY